MSKLILYWIRILSITCFFLFSKQVDAQFIGGQAGGHSNSRISNVVCVATNANPFAGGQAGGHSNSRISNVVCVATNVNPFAGGQADGHSNSRISNVVCVATNVNPFAGGQADGHSNSRIFNVVCVATNVNPFAGGQADGHSNSRISNVVCVATNANPFAGGESDGHSNVSFTNFPTNTCVALPVELVSFEVLCYENFISVSWITTSEINNKNFEIEKSGDGITFSTIGIVEGAGNSNQKQHYIFKDVAKWNQIAYYRLKKSDFQSGFEYSAIVKSDCINNKSEKFLIYPNPGINELVIENVNKINNYNKIEIIDAIGQLIFQGTILNKQIINTTNYASGVYLIKFDSGESYKWIKQK